MLGLEVMAWVMFEVFTTVTNYLDRGKKANVTHQRLMDYSRISPPHILYGTTTRIVARV